MGLIEGCLSFGTTSVVFIGSLKFDFFLTMIGILGPLDSIFFSLVLPER